MKENYNIFKFILCILSLIVLGFGFFAPQTNIIISITGVIIFACLILFHIYTPKIANLSADNPKVKTMRQMNVFSMIMIFICFSIINWMPEIPFLNKNENTIEFMIVLAFVVIIGNIAPKIPFNRYMGLRLPWTIRDEATWRIAHRILGYLTFPVSIIMVVGFLVGCSELFIEICVIGWVLIPSLYSCYYYYLRLQYKR